MTPKIGSIAGWRVILACNESSERRTVVVEAGTKRGAGTKARKLWDRKCHIYDCSPVWWTDPASAHH